MLERAATGEAFANGRHEQAGQRARRLPLPFKRGFERETVHHGGQHAHAVADRARYAAPRDFHAAKDIAAADHHAELDTELLRRDQVACDTVDCRLVDAAVLLAGKGFAGQLHYNATIDRLSHGVFVPQNGLPE